MMAVRQFSTALTFSIVLLACSGNAEEDIKTYNVAENNAVVSHATITDSKEEIDQQRKPTSNELIFYTYEIVNRFPHDPTAFTQGLFFHNGYLYESTGLRGQSSLRRVTLDTGEPDKKIAFDDVYFGEGSVLWKDRIITLTWQAGKALVHTLDGFEPIGEFDYSGEGWGITTDGEQLIVSDGTPSLRFFDPETFVEKDPLPIILQGRPIRSDFINELEWVEGKIFANLWMTEWIAIIDPASGVVTGVIDLKGLGGADIRDPSRDVLNGIAYDAVNKRLFVTGKNWRNLYEIELVERAQ